MKMADLKAFVETKLLSKSDKALEKIGQDDPKPLSDQIVIYKKELINFLLFNSYIFFRNIIEA